MPEPMPVAYSNAWAAAGVAANVPQQNTAPQQGPVRCPECNNFVMKARPGSAKLSRHGPRSRPCSASGKTLAEAADSDIVLFKGEPGNVYPDIISGAHGKAYDDPPRQYDPAVPHDWRKDWMIFNKPYKSWS